MNLHALGVALAAIAFVALLAFAGQVLGAWSRAASRQERASVAGRSDVRSVAAAASPVAAEVVGQVILGQQDCGAVQAAVTPRL